MQLHVLPEDARDKRATHALSIEHALDQAARGTILNAQGTEGCRRLIHVQGADTRDITVKDCRAPAGASAVTFEHAALRKAVRVS